MENEPSPTMLPSPTAMPPVKDQSGGQTVRTTLKSIIAHTYPNRGPPSAYGSRTSALGGGSQLLPSTGLSKSGEMLKELQQYICNVEHLAAQRKIELDRLQEQRREMDRRLRFPTADRGPYGRAPSLGKREDDPVNLRALREDLKVMKERVRKYKERCMTAERGAAAANQQLMRLQDKHTQLESMLLLTHRTQSQIMDDKRARDEGEAKDAKIEDLERKVGVLTKAKEVQAKRHKTELSELRKEIEELGKEIGRLQGCIGEKDKEVRVEAMKVKNLRRKIDPIRRQLVQGLLLTSPLQTSPSEVMGNSGFFGHPEDGEGVGNDHRQIITSLQQQVQQLQESLQHYRDKLAQVGNSENGAQTVRMEIIVVDPKWGPDPETATTSGGPSHDSSTTRRGPQQHHPHAHPSLRADTSNNEKVTPDEEAPSSSLKMGSVSSSLPLDFRGVDHTSSSGNNQSDLPNPRQGWASPGTRSVPEPGGSGPRAPDNGGSGGDPSKSGGGSGGRGERVGNATAPSSGGNLGLGGDASARPAEGEKGLSPSLGHSGAQIRRRSSEGDVGKRAADL